MTTSDLTAGLSRAKRLARRLMDRVAEPYVTDSVRRVVESLATDQTQPLPATPPVVLHAALHEGRSIALADMPPGAEVVLTRAPMVCGTSSGSTRSTARSSTTSGSRPTCRGPTAFPTTSSGSKPTSPRRRVWPRSARDRSTSCSQPEFGTPLARPDRRLPRRVEPCAPRRRAPRRRQPEPSAHRGLPVEHGGAHRRARAVRGRELVGAGRVRRRADEGCVALPRSGSPAPFGPDQRHVRARGLRPPGRHGHGRVRRTPSSGGPRRARSVGRIPLPCAAP